MKKSKVLATTTLAGALLFTGVGATHNANAAENVTKSQAEERVKNFVTNSNEYSPKQGTKYTAVKDDYADPDKPSNTYNIAFGEGLNQSPVFLYVNKDTGDIYDPEGNLIQKATTTSNTTQDTTNNNTQSTDNTQAATNNETTNNEATNNNTTVATDNNVSTPENNTQSTQSNETQSNEAQALPETGGQSNSGLVTIVASVLLAAGSLLAFRRTSNSK